MRRMRMESRLIPRQLRQGCTSPSITVLKGGVGEMEGDTESWEGGCQQHVSGSPRGVDGRKERKWCVGLRCMVFGESWLSWSDACVMGWCRPRDAAGNWRRRGELWRGGWR
ncbi:hypothetical protein HNY73_020115 [Argiope bruennichi]|uniref:Uncharacterized protein n=1 Tax=Argiope bruennichi TaxID=94029 RepID=A0A8T0E6L0_ARGBR|nr:hypothetical protein HNY73_020115 [Argiope bruennichi]